MRNHDFHGANHGNQYIQSALDITNPPVFTSIRCKVIAKNFKELNWLVRYNESY